MSSKLTSGHIQKGRAPTTELAKRVLTGVIGGAALLGLILFGGRIGVFLLATGLSLGMIYEFSQMIFGLPDRVEKRYLLLVLAWLISFFYLLMPQIEFALFIATFLGLFGYYLFTAKRHTEDLYLQHFTELVFSFFGVVYLIFIPQFLQKIYELPQGPKWIILFLLMVWSCDTGAYFAGKKFGKKKLYREISPNKTIEGLAGGLITAAGVTLIYRFTVLSHVSVVGVVVLALLVGVVAQVGDLCESFLKRAYHKKDSGSILPGHGGILDRFDAIVFSIPIMYAGIRIFM